MVTLEAFIIYTPRNRPHPMRAERGFERLNKKWYVVHRLLGQAKQLANGVQLQVLEAIDSLCVTLTSLAYRINFACTALAF